MTDNNASETAIGKLLNDRQVGIFLYYSAIILIGLFILRSYIAPPVVDYQGLLPLGIYLILVMMLEPPSSAEMRSDPFEDTELIDL